MGVAWQPGFLLLRLAPGGPLRAGPSDRETELAELAGGAECRVQPGAYVRAEEVELVGPDRRCAADRQDPFALTHRLRLGGHDRAGDLRPEALGAGQDPRGR